MTTYSLVHAGFAASSAAMMAVHLVLWATLRGERVQLWVAVCHGSLALVQLGAAGAGSLSSTPGRAPWMELGILAGPLHAALALAIWALYGIAVDRVRRAVLAALIAGSAFMTVERALAATGLTRSPASSEELMFGGPFAAVAAILIVAPLMVWLVESVQQLRKQPVVASAAILVAVATSGWIGAWALAGAREYYALGGTPFLVFASTTVVAGYIRNARRAEDAGEWRLIRPIASGGMGELFVAEKTGPGGFKREAAVKRILPSMPGEEANAFEARFLSEARLAARLSHPNVVTVFDFGRLDGGGWFLAMELLHGKSLAEIREALAANGAQAPVEIVAAVGEQICRGLAAAHAEGIVHRDVSPQNVMLTRDGVAKLIDFGIAKAVDAAELAGSAQGSRPDGLTSPGKVLGKLGYLAPEQLEGQPASPASDVWAAGVVLYELATGCRPYRRREEPSMLPQRDRWVPASALRRDVPAAVDAALTKALAWNAKERGTSSMLAESLRGAAASLPFADLGGFVRALEIDAGEGATAAIPVR